MGLDIFFINNDFNTNHLVMSEKLHKEIFSSSTRWSSFKTLRKIKDYYRADCILKNKDAHAFLDDLHNIKFSIVENKHELDTLLTKINITNEKNPLIRISSD